MLPNEMPGAGSAPVRESPSPLPMPRVPGSRRTSLSSVVSAGQVTMAGRNAFFPPPPQVRGVVVPVFLQPAKSFIDSEARKLNLLQAEADYVYAYVADNYQDDGVLVEESAGFYKAKTALNIVEMLPRDIAQPDTGANHVRHITQLLPLRSYEYFVDLHACFRKLIDAEKLTVDSFTSLMKAANGKAETPAAIKAVADELVTERACRCSVM